MKLTMMSYMSCLESGSSRLKTRLEALAALNNVARSTLGSLLGTKGLIVRRLVSGEDVPNCGNNALRGPDANSFNFANGSVMFRTFVERSKIFVNGHCPSAFFALSIALFMHRSIVETAGLDKAARHSMPHSSPTGFRDVPSAHF